jgi:hypothetical protein
MEDFIAEKHLTVEVSTYLDPLCRHGRKVGECVQWRGKNKDGRARAEL